ncbi:5-formyltetrahydrofolate cyclo-ligase [Carboxylicivirga sp. RSCT41]|uniref:5-formyltetrahydrofolate cyclo-ligase n=1 Tax=Carboxylicivirga agarovorans TaxID=3417570 RepID=UPI003D34BAEC
MIEQKKELRKNVRELKKLLSTAERNRQSKIIHRKLEETALFKSARSILLYWSLPDEVPTESLVNKWFKDKKIYLPVIDGDDLKIVQYTGESSLVAGDKYGIPEPDGPVLEDEQSIEIVIVPGVAFDTNNNRLGRGAGYYDRILKRIPFANKIAFAFDFQMVDTVPVEEHDIKMDIIINPH